MKYEMPMEDLDSPTNCSMTDVFKVKKQRTMTIMATCLQKSYTWQTVYGPSSKDKLEYTRELNKN